MAALLYRVLHELDAENYAWIAIEPVPSDTAWAGVADRLQSMAARAECMAAFGEIVAHEGRLAEGLALMRWAIGQPTLDRLDRDMTERRIAALLARHDGEPEPFELPRDAPFSVVLTVAASTR